MSDAVAKRPPRTWDTIERRHLVAEHIVPGHCTGWRAIHDVARRLPDAYVQPSVGTTLRFTAA